MKESVSLLRITADFLQKQVEPVRKEDLSIIKEFIGRTSADVVSITKRCHFGYPQVFLSSPLIRGKPFPTLFWLCCPYLVREVARLESKKLQRKIMEILKDNPHMKNEMDTVDKKFKEFRRILTKALNVKLPENVLATSIAGSQKTWSLKCLHAYLALELSGLSTPVGRVIVNELSDLECQQPCIKFGRQS